MEQQFIPTSANNLRVFTLGESAIVLEYKNIDALSNQEKLAFQQHLLTFANDCRRTSNNSNPFDSKGFINAIPGNLNVTLRFDPLQTTATRIQAWAFTLWHTLADLPSTNTPLITLPVHYGGKYGPDLETVADSHNLSTDDVMQLHSSTIYTVLFNGFLPGFPYLAGLPESLYTPRRSTPRLRVAKGSIAIGGSQTGVYPCQSPGGWQIIGRLTADAHELFDPRKPSVLLAAGNTVTFEPA